MRSPGTLATSGVAVGLAGLPLLRPGLPGNTGPADLGLMMGLGAVLVSLTASRQPLRWPFAWPVALAAIAGLGAGWAGDYPALGLLAVTQDLYLLAWCLAIANVARDPAAARFVVKAWCTTSAIWASVLLGVLLPQLLSASALSTRASFTADTNGAGLYFVLSIFVALSGQWPRRPALRLFVITLLAVDTVLTGSLGALSGLLAGLAVALLLAVLARSGPAPALVLCLALGMAVASTTLLAERYRVADAAHQSKNPLIRNSLGRESQSVAERASLAEETMGLVATTGLAGRGPNSTLDVLNAEQAPYPKQTHNDWIASYIERGPLGLLAMVLLAAEIARRASGVWDRSRLAPGFSEAVPQPRYLVGALAVLLVFSLTHEVLHDRTAWTALGLLGGLAVWGRRTAIA